VLFSLNKAKSKMFGFFKTSSGYSLDDLSIPPNKPNPLADVEPEVEYLKLRLEVSTRLGWISWKETESSLYKLLETTFGAANCSVEFTDSLNRVLLDLEIPSQYFQRFKKALKGKSLPVEIGNLMFNVSQ
jgi:hypothetical protein